MRVYRHNYVYVEAHPRSGHYYRRYPNGRFEMEGLVKKVFTFEDLQDLDSISVCSGSCSICGSLASDRFYAEALRMPCDDMQEPSKTLEL
jgi:hypothetical protein